MIHSLTTTRLLLAASLCLGASLAQAANGYTVNASQEAMVQMGMTRAEVMSAIGRPAHNLKYGNEPGRTWTYGVTGTYGVDGGAGKVFDVDFTAEGKVMSKSGRTESMN